MVKEFNLLKEPWICAVNRSGEVNEESLPDILAHAHEYVRLAGETPLQDIAILRLLLAVLQTVTYRYDKNGKETTFRNRLEALDRWKEIWEDGKFPEKIIQDYLNQWEDRFWLFHPIHPFYQIQEAIIGTEYSAAKLNGEICESNRKKRLFANRNEETKYFLDYAEAARWLLYVNGFDDTSGKPTKPPKKEKPKEESTENSQTEEQKPKKKTKKEKEAEKKPSPGAGWLGKLELIYTEGQNLFETLMLNLVMVTEHGGLWTTPKPTWERPPKADERTEIPIPTNQAELLTLQSRRLLLKREEEKVTGFYALGGDFFNKQNAFAEQMTIWCKVTPEEGEPYFMPSREEPEQQIWRGLANMVRIDSSQRSPGTVDWLKYLLGHGCIKDKSFIRLRTAAACYVDKDFCIKDMVGDYVDLYPGILADAHPEFANLIQTEISLCEKAAGCIYRLVVELRKATGTLKDNSGQYEKEEFYSLVDIPFRKWIYQITPEQPKSLDNLSEEWRKQLRKIALDYGRQLVDQAGERAYVGRAYKEGETERYYAAADSFGLFCSGLKKCLNTDTNEKEDHSDKRKAC